MRKFLLLAACVFISLAWLLPIHYRPWVTFTGELYAFLSLFALAALFFNKKIYVPSISIPLFLLALIPLIQWCFGEVFFFSKALMCSLYILGCWFSIIVGFNLNYIKNPEEVFKGVSVVFLICGTLTGIIAICQWLGLDAYLPGMADLKSSRPYANFAQPNNMATFLIMALFATFYLGEKNFIKKWLLVICATIMLFAIALSQSRTSWIVAFFIFFLFLIFLKKGLLKIKWYKLLSWFSLYVFFVAALPFLNTLISQTVNLSIVNTESALERATSGHLRIWIWLQMLYAISDQPLWGYGWHQTSVAQMLVSEYYRVPAWLRSAHNFILDFLVWNGLILGIPYLLYFLYWGYRLVSYISSLEQLMAISMLSAVLIHSMFEFPLFYAYFLLPCGFLIGFLCFFMKNKKLYIFNSNFIKISFVAGILALCLICRDYYTLVPKLNESIRYEKYPELILNNNKIYILDEFEDRIDWIRLDPRTKVNSNQLLEIEKMVLNYPTRYDLIKYARLLAFNGYEKEARHQLWRLKHIKKVDVEYNSLFNYP